MATRKTGPSIGGFYIPTDDGPESFSESLLMEGYGPSDGQYAVHIDFSKLHGASGDCDGEDWEERAMRKVWRSNWELKF